MAQGELEVIRSSLSSIAGADISNRAWDQAALPMRAGRLGLRGVEDHAYAACVASFRGSVDLALRIDRAFDPEDLDNFSGLRDAVAGLGARVRPDAAINLGAAGSKQKRLSMLIDA